MVREEEGLSVEEVEEGLVRIGTLSAVMEINKHTPHNVSIWSTKGYVCFVTIACTSIHVCAFTHKDPCMKGVHYSLFI